MKHAVRGLFVLALALAATLFGFGRFSAMEQGPPGTAFHETSENKTFGLHAIIIAPALAIAVGIALGLAAGQMRVRVLRFTLMKRNNFSLSAVLAYVRKLVPVSHFKSSRLQTVI